MERLRTDDSRFADLPDFPWQPHYLEVGQEKLRMHYLDEGPRDGEVLLCVHGQPTWCYLYRRMIPLLVEAGFRVVAPDLIGFGRSDKPAAFEDYNYARHVGWLSDLVEGLDLRGATLVGQDWGGLIGLRVVTDLPDRFARIAISNTGLPDVQHRAPEEAAAMRKQFEGVPALPPLEMARKMGSIEDGSGFMYWIKHCRDYAEFSPAAIVGLSVRREGGISEQEVAAYAAPFPSEEYLQGARRFPTLVPIFPDDPAIPDNRAAWEVLRRWEKPLLTAFTDSDRVTAGGEVRFQKEVPGAKGQKHVTLQGGGHFVQEDCPEGFSTAIIDFCRANPQA